MAEKIYNKLVRDLIPAVIEKDGNTCTFSIAPPEEHAALLNQKMQEEMQEYLESHAPEELCDLVEVIRARLQLMGCTWEDMETLRLQKRQSRGGFEKGVVLHTVTEKEK